MRATLAAVALVASLAAGCTVSKISQHPPAPTTEVTIEPASPSPATSPSPVAAVSPTLTPTPGAGRIPVSAFMKIPYTPQAPKNNWDTAHEEYCEAAAALMVGSFFRGDRRSVIPPDEADQRMAQIVDYERKTWPGSLDLTLDRVGQTANFFYGLKPVVEPATLDGVKREIAAGHPVILPLMTHGGPGGQKISPHYGSVSVYHVLLVTGYDPQKIYTNDAGFVEGQNWSYTWDVLQAAIDAQTSKTGQGRVMLALAGS